MQSPDFFGLVPEVTKGLSSAARQDSGVDLHALQSQHRMDSETSTLPKPTIPPKQITPFERDASQTITNSHVWQGHRTVPMKVLVLGNPTWLPLLTYNTDQEHHFRSQSHWHALHPSGLVPSGLFRCLPRDVV